MIEVLSLNHAQNLTLTCFNHNICIPSVTILLALFVVAGRRLRKLYGFGHVKPDGQARKLMDSTLRPPKKVAPKVFGDQGAACWPSPGWQVLLQKRLTAPLERRSLSI